MFFPSICHEVREADSTILVFWMLSFKSAFPLLLFHLHQEAHVTHTGHNLSKWREHPGWETGVLPIHPSGFPGQMVTSPCRALNETHKLWKGTYKIPGKLFFFPIKNIYYLKIQMKKKKSHDTTERRNKEFSKVKFLRTSVMFILRDPCGGKSFFFYLPLLLPWEILVFSKSAILD